MNLEVRTVTAMIRIYCRAHHSTAADLCDDCAGLLAYAEQRIGTCPFGAEKPVCNNCTIHCYKPDPREQIKGIMRYAGPRMLLRHPMLALRHLIRSKRYSGGRSK